MHVLISGGTGFIGTALCAHLTERGNRVSILSRQPENVPRRCGPGVRGVRDLEALGPEDPVDAIINLAGASIANGRWTPARKQELVESRLRVTDSLVQFMTQCEVTPKRFISASAVGYYGAQGDQPLDERAEPHPEFQHELCAQWEASAREAAQRGISTAIVRLGIVLGPNGGALANMLLPFRLGLGGRIGNGRQWMSWVHRQDVLRALEFLLTTPELQGTFNLTAPAPVTNAVFTRTLGQVLHRPAILPVPGFMLRILLGEFAHLLLTGQRVIPRRMSDAGFNFQYPNLSGALQEILQPG